MKAAGATPKVSVCVITYNHEAYIATCLQSIVDQQADFDFEVVVSDDCSTDGTRAIVDSFAQRYPNHVRRLHQPSNLGGCRNYLSVHRSATAEFTCHCDGDDYWCPGKLQAQVVFLEQHPACACVFTNASVVADGGSPIGTFSSGVPSEINASYLIRRGNFLTHSSMMYRTACRDDMLVDGADFIDLQLYLRISRRGLLGFIDKPLVCYRDNSSGSTIRANNARIRTLYWQALEGVDETMVTPAALRDAKAEFLASASRYELLHGNWENYRAWRSLVRQASPGDFARIQSKAVWLTARSLAVSLASRLKSLLNKQSADGRVFHPR